MQEDINFFLWINSNLKYMHTNSKDWTHRNYNLNAGVQSNLRYKTKCYFEILISKLHKLQRTKLAHNIYAYYYTTL